MRNPEFRNGSGIPSCVIGRTIDGCPRSAFLVSADADPLLSFGQLEAWAEIVARCLQKNGVDAGDVVVAELPNSPAFVAVMSAVWNIGGVFAPVDPRLSARQKQQTFTLAAPRVVVAPILASTESPTLLWRNPFEPRRNSIGYRPRPLPAAVGADDARAHGARGLPATWRAGKRTAAGESWDGSAKLRTAATMRWRRSMWRRPQCHPERPGSGSEPDVTSVARMSFAVPDPIRRRCGCGGRGRKMCGRMSAAERRRLCRPAVGDPAPRLHRSLESGRHTRIGADPRQGGRRRRSTGTAVVVGRALTSART
ncbi:AMP-binding protein [Nocardia sp. NPDC050630]|uniref:AMP-binding protein n=1 Tax=Nocardia sp. NPDC050630 TaxID=3364321 RepID=UPI00378DE0CC